VIRRYYQQNIDLLTTLFQQGIAQGEFKPDCALEAALALGR